MWITRTSPLTGTTRSLDLPITESQMQKRREGALIQNAFPNLSASEREFYMTGIVDEEWDELMRRKSERRSNPMESSVRCYRIIRFHASGNQRVIRNNVTLAEAQRHCSDPKTHGVRGGRRWFDGYDYMRGCRPKDE